MEIGSKGLENANLVIPQATTLAFRVVHTDAEGATVDHSGSTCRMALQSKDGQTTYDLSACCTPGSEGIEVNVPPEETAKLPLGKMQWDLIVSTQAGEAIRMLYGTAQVVDTYAMDGE